MEDGQDFLNYEVAPDLKAITRRQLQEDISSYRYDIDYCRALLAGPELAPQEVRTLHVRLIDSAHHIRECQHRIEMIDAQAALGINGASTRKPAGPLQQFFPSRPYNNGGGTPVPSTAPKRKRPKTADTTEDEGVEPTEGDSIDVATNNSNNNTSSVQRLGFWKCRLCTAQKYLNAGSSRVPSEPGKWPLKDVSKMLNHFLDLHTEHLPEERCRELGDALAQNRE